MYCLAYGKELFIETLARTKTGCWQYGFDVVSEREYGFKQNFWQKWKSSMRAAKRLGYSFREVEIVPKAKGAK